MWSSLRPTWCLPCPQLLALPSDQGGWLSHQGMAAGLAPARHRWLPKQSAESELAAGVLSDEVAMRCARSM